MGGPDGDTPLSPTAATTEIDVPEPQGPVQRGREEETGQTRVPLQAEDRLGVFREGALDVLRNGGPVSCSLGRLA